MEEVIDKQIKALYDDAVTMDARDRIQLVRGLIDSIPIGAS